MIIDETTELSGDRNISASQSNRQNRDLSAILTPQSFIPASRTVIRLLAIRDDPVAHYLPTQIAAKGGDELLCAGPPGLGPELASLYLLPLGMLRRRREARGEDEQSRKKARVEAGEEDEDVEAGRRESRALSLGLGGSSRVGGDDLTFGREDFMGGGDAFPMDDNDNFDLGDAQPWNDDLDGIQDALEFNADGTSKPRKPRARRSGAGRNGEDGDDEDDEDNQSNGNGVLDDVGADAYDDNQNEGSVAGSMAPASGGGPLDIFDTRPRRADGGAASSQDESQRSKRSGSRAGSARSASVAAGGDETGSSAADEGGRVRHVSRNTARAMGVLRRELGVDKKPVIGAALEEKKISFKQISEKVS